MMKSYNPIVFSILLLILFSSQLFDIQAKTIQLKVTTLNTEWLSCPTYGPEDDELQISNIATVINTMQPDIIVLQEVGTSSSYATIDTLLHKLGDEWGGSINPAFNDNCGQNLGMIYRKPKIRLVSSSTLSSGISSQGNSYYYNWSSGRYPVVHEINVVDGDSLIPITIVNLHAKAMSDETSYTRRKGASEGLKTILDGNAYNTKRVIITGDFNDYLIGSQCNSCGDSPYLNFMDDAANYKGLTTGLQNPYYNNPLIDNIVISNELFDNYVQGSARLETNATSTISNYLNTTSDHTPVSALFNLQVAGTEPGDCADIAFSETFGSGLGSFQPYNTTGYQTWYWRDVYGACVSGYASGVNNENEDWLISPALNLSGMQSATLSFEHALNYAPDEIEKLTNHTVWISSDYQEGNPNAVSWEQLTVPVMPQGNNWTFVNSGNIGISAPYLTENTRIAFKYLSTTSTAGTWEIRNLGLNSVCATTANNPAKTELISAYGTNGRIKIKVNQPTAVSVYDMMGRRVFVGQVTEETDIQVSTSGIYLVQTGLKLHKVLVKQ